MTIKTPSLPRWLWVGLLIGIISVWAAIAIFWIQNRQVSVTATMSSNPSTVVSAITVASRSSNTDIPQPTATITGITATPYPTDYPPAKQTLEWREMLTRQAALLTPAPPPGAKAVSTLPPSTYRPRVPKGTPVGDGVITTDVGSPPIARMSFDWTNSWFKITGETEYVIVYAGLLRGTESQGYVILVRNGDGADAKEYSTPLKAGSVQIVGAQGERLILLSDQGMTFYFDVAGERFVNSLTEVVPSVTPAPTKTPFIVYTYTRRPTSTSTPVR